MRPPLTARRLFRLQFPFVFRRIHSPQMLPPTHPCLATFSGPSIPLLSQLPFRFLTPSVLTFFRPSQFRVLTTKPLFFLSFSSRFRLTAASPVPVSALASSVSPLSPAWFPVPSFQVLVLGSTVRFLSLFPASLPQPFHRCLPSSPLPLVRLSSGLFHFHLAFFRPLAFRFQLLSLLLFLSSSSRFCLAAAFPVPALALAFLGFPSISGLVSRAFLPGFCTRLCCWFPFALP